MVNVLVRVVLYRVNFPHFLLTYFSEKCFHTLPNTLWLFPKW